MLFLPDRVEQIDLVICPERRAEIIDIFFGAHILYSFLADCVFFTLLNLIYIFIIISVTEKYNPIVSRKFAIKAAN
jgi:hypothetical protein